MLGAQALLVRDWGWETNLAVREWLNTHCRPADLDESVKVWDLHFVDRSGTLQASTTHADAAAMAEAVLRAAFPDRTVGVNSRLEHGDLVHVVSCAKDEIVLPPMVVGNRAQRRAAKQRAKRRQTWGGT